MAHVIEISRIMSKKDELSRISTKEDPLERRIDTRLQAAKLPQI
jgi:hypothetical protein